MAGKASQNRSRFAYASSAALRFYNFGLPLLSLYIVLHWGQAQKKP